MTTTRPIFGAGRFRVSRISYFCDVTSTSGAVIPLGVIADIRVGELYGLGLMARKTISDAEAEKVGALARGMIREPFKMLSNEFDKIISAQEPDSVFADLPLVHATALVFANPSASQISIPRQLAAHSDDEAALGSWARDKLQAQLIDGFWALLDEHWAEDPATNHRLKLVAA